MVNNYVAVDIETSGLNPKYDRILEIGAVKVNNGEIMERFHCIINAGVVISERITQLTGITQDIVNGGIELREAMNQFYAFCKEDIILGHNIGFDYSFLKKASVNLGHTFEKSAIDTLKLARVFLPDLEKRSLEYLTEYFNITTAQHHRAYDDAKAASELYQILLKKFYAVSPLTFEPKPLVYSVKKESPVTPRQKKYLGDLLSHYELTLEVKIDSLSKNEASRIIDKIIFENGKIT